MSEEDKPEPITFSDGTTTAFTPTPMLTGTAATLSGGDSVTSSPMAQDNVKFVMGPNGQMIAIQKEPFVWKKFFIGLGIPLFLMVIPLILSLIADGMTSWDDEYETEIIQFELLNGTTYVATYSLDSSREIGYCDIWIDHPKGWYNCHTDGSTEMHIHKDTQIELELIRNNETAYTANFSMESGESFSGCDDWCDNSWDSRYWCDYDDETSSDEFIIIKETWTEDRDIRKQVGHWNSTAEVIHFDDEVDHGSELGLMIIVDEEVGHWFAASGEFTFDSEVSHGSEFRMNIETIDSEVYDEMESNRQAVDILLGISTLMCCSAPIVTIGMIIYGFAATGGKPIGVGAVVALVAYPVIAFFTMITAMVATY